MRLYIAHLGGFYYKKLKKSLDSGLYVAHIGHMSRTTIIQMIEIISDARGRSPHTVGRLASGSGDFYIRLKRGHDLTTRRATVVMQYLSDHWPAGLEWPAEIPRPERSGAKLPREAA